MTNELATEMQGIYDRCYANQEHVCATDAETLVKVINLLERPVSAEITQLRGNLSLAEEGLANYALEVERLRATLTTAHRWLSNHGRHDESQGPCYGRKSPYPSPNTSQFECRCGLHDLIKQLDSGSHEPIQQRCDCWERISALIVKGPLEGNGLDPTAQRNGLILAANQIAPFNRAEAQGASRDASSEPSERHVDWEAEYKKLAGVYTREGLEKFIADHWPGNVLADATESKSNSCHCPAKPGEDCPLTSAECDARRAQTSYE